MKTYNKVIDVCGLGVGSSSITSVFSILRSWPFAQRFHYRKFIDVFEKVKITRKSLDNLFLKSSA